MSAQGRWRSIALGISQASLRSDFFNALIVWWADWLTTRSVVGGCVWRRFAAP
jgi:hypothetical protein